MFQRFFFDPHKAAFLFHYKKKEKKTQPHGGVDDKGTSITVQPLNTDSQLRLGVSSSFLQTSFIPCRAELPTAQDRITNRIRGQRLERKTGLGEPFVCFKAVRNFA